MEFEIINLHDEVVLYVMNGFRECGFVRDKQIGGIDVQILHFINRFPGLWAERCDPVYLVVPELDPISHSLEGFNGRKNVYGFTFCPETAPFEFQFVVHVKGIHQTA